MRVPSYLWHRQRWNSEFWPMWTYYLPVWLQHLFLTLRTGSPFFFLRTNPGIDGFILSDSKTRTLELVPGRHRPRGFLVPCGSTAGEVLRRMRFAQIAFPVILKPDIGFRGLQVSRIISEGALADKLWDSRVDLLLQEYIPGSLELGIFYYRYPGSQKGHIPSVARKEFLHVTGNGRDSLAELVSRDFRARMQMERLRKEFVSQWHDIPDRGAVVRLGWIGNHNLGTLFQDARDLADTGLRTAIDRMALEMNGFYFGRFDIRADSPEALKKGDFRVLEVNGIGAEPAHIYDPSVGYFRAVRDLCRTWRIAARIARLNMASGRETPTYREARRLWDRFTAYRSRLATS